MKEETISRTLRRKQIPGFSGPAYSERKGELKPTGCTEALRPYEYKRLGIAATTFPGRRKQLNHDI
jgi:hypothetical protein